MDQVTLSATPRTDQGTRPSRRARAEGLIPAVVYGRDQETISIEIGRRELYAALRTEAGLNALITVDVEGAESVLTVAREIQRHPVRGDITHVDLIKVSLDVAIEADVAIEYVGTPIGVREDGSILETLATTVLVEALPNAVPSSIELDITDLETGSTMLIGDLPELEGVVYVEDADRPLVTLAARREEEEEVVVVLEEGDEGFEAQEAAEGAEGAEGSDSEGDDS